MIRGTFTKKLQHKHFNKKLMLFIMSGLLITFCILSLSACDKDPYETNTNIDYCTTANLDKMDFNFTDRDINAKYSDKVINVNLDNPSNIEGAERDGNTLTLKNEATYILKGTIDDGQVCIDANDAKVQIVLDGANITNTHGSAIYIKNCKKAFITTANNSVNRISDGPDYFDETEDGPNATIYSKEDLTLNGTGILSINGNHKHAVHSKDNLLVCGGTYKIEAIEDGLRGKDCIKINNGTFDIAAGENGIVSSDKNDDNKGYVSINDGKFSIKAGKNGIKSQTYSKINNGSYVLTTENDGLNSNVRIDINGGNIEIAAGDDGIHTEAELNINNGNINVINSTEGFEAEVVNINGGTHNIFATDDGINSSAAEWNANNSVNMLEKEMPEGMEDFDPSEMPDMDQNPKNNMQQPPMGNQQDNNFERSKDVPGMPDGNQDNYQNKQDNNIPQMPQGDMGGKGQKGNNENSIEPPDAQMPEDTETSPMGYYENCKININGGTLNINAYGDGLDSNGDITINGGTVLVNGPESGGDSALDFGEGGNATINGGNVLMVGSQEMAESFSGGKQPFNLSSTSGVAGQKVSIVDASGNKIIELTATKSFSCVISSCTQFNTSSNYTILVDGKQTTTFTPSTKSTTKGFGGMGENFNEGFKGFGNQSNISQTPNNNSNSKINTALNRQNDII